MIIESLQISESKKKKTLHNLAVNGKENKAVGLGIMNQQIVRNNFCAFLILNL